MPVFEPGVLRVSKIIHGKNDVVGPGFLQSIANRLGDRTTQDSAHGLIQEHVVEIAADPDGPGIVAQVTFRDLRKTAGGGERLRLNKIYLLPLHRDYAGPIRTQIVGEPAQQEKIVP